MKTLITVFIILGALTASAKNASVTDCQELDNIDYVAETWENSTRTFAQGKVRVVHVDTHGEPVCCSSRMLVLIEDPNAEVPGMRMCFAITQNSEKLGFYNLDVRKIKSSYDADGLLLDLPVSLYGEDGKGKSSNVKIRINRMRKNAVSIE